MRKLAVLSAAIATLGGASFASAADLSYKDTPSYEAAPAAIWGGLYVGGHVGGLWNDGGGNSGFFKDCKDEWQKIQNAKFSDKDDDATLIGGIHVGYNWQSGARVFGVEADADIGGGIDYLASLRARLGYARDNLLIYATAGVAFAGFDDTTVDSKIGNHEHTSSFSGDNKVGLVVGAGAEYKLASNLSVGVEGLYYFFGDSNDSDEWKHCWNDFKVTREDDNDMFVVRARMSYHMQDAYEEPLK